MADRGGSVLSVVRAVCRAHDVRIWQVDAEIHGRRERKPSAFRGGGGTDLRAAMYEASQVSDLLVVITDCDTPWPEARTVPTIAVTWPGCCAAPSWAERVEVSP